MPTLEDHEHDPDQEKAYRRGYVHGIKDMMSGIVEKLRDDERQRIESWFREDLFQWSLGDTTQSVSPPEFPKL